QRLLRRSVNGASAEEFRHDGANNVAVATAAASFGPGDRVVASGGTSYVWDRDARLTAKTEVGDDGGTRRWVYRWNAAGLLAGTACPGGRILRTIYDGYSRRVQKAVFRRSESGTEELVSRTYFVWNQSRLLHELVERFGSGAEPEVEVRSYVHGPRGPLAHRVGTLEAPGEWVFYVNDVLDTPEELISGRGDLLQRYQRAAYGHSVATLDSPVNTPLRFPGQYADEETGLHYNQYRYYDPVACSYISPDPAGGAAGPQRLPILPQPDRLHRPARAPFCERVLRQPERRSADPRDQPRQLRLERRRADVRSEPHDQRGSLPRSQQARAASVQHGALLGYRSESDSRLLFRVTLEEGFTGVSRAGYLMASHLEPGAPAGGIRRPSPARRPPQSAQDGSRAAKRATVGRGPLTRPSTLRPFSSRWAQV